MGHDGPELASRTAAAFSGSGAEAPGTAAG